MSDRRIAAGRLAASWLLSYPDQALLERLDAIGAVADELQPEIGGPIRTFLEHLKDVPLTELQQHYVLVFDMKRKACPYLSYWSDGDTRNRGRAILRFKQAYLDAGFELDNSELPDHLAVVLEFAAIGDVLTGEALLAEHQEAIHLLREALAVMDSAYAHVLDAVIATLPALTPQVRERMAQIASTGPPAEQVGLEPFGRMLTLEPTGARR